MCDALNGDAPLNAKVIPVDKAVGTVLAHDITEIRPGEFKGRAFRKGHVVRQEDVCHLQRLGKEHLFVLEIAEDEMHEDEAAHALAHALAGEGVCIKGEPKEGKITLAAEHDGLLSVERDALLQFNMTGDVMCATLHGHTVVKKGQEVAATRAIPLVVKRSLVEEAVGIARGSRPGFGLIEVRKMRRPKAGIVITGNEVYEGRIKDAFGPVIRQKIEAFGGEIVGIYYAPDNREFIRERLRELLNAGADLLITTGGMSVDPDDVTRFAIRDLGAEDIVYGSAVLPGAMVLVAYLEPSDGSLVMSDELKKTSEDLSHITHHASPVPVIGIPACGMYAKATVFDLILPRILVGERINRRELAELGHGGLCMKCPECRYPVCPFGK